MSHATVWVTTNDGSFGKKGFVTDQLKSRLEQIKEDNKDAFNDIVFYNCGPEPMINAVLPIEEKFVSKENIFCAIDYVTKCGVGVCGACSSKSGKRICVDGPFINRVVEE
jgi:dihydroorotate dehydrogenase (NAD+) catalytic subunit